LLGLEAEIIVIDNHSTDGSIAYLKPLFPTVRFIENTENMGFAKANNRALAYASGEYILFLNPDTLIAENCFALCLGFMGQNPKAGAIGVRMIDGSGRF
jgi:GT2 family glycosyltransferase